MLFFKVLTDPFVYRKVLNVINVTNLIIVISVLTFINRQDKGLIVITLYNTHYIFSCSCVDTAKPGVVWYFHCCELYVTFLISN